MGATGEDGNGSDQVDEPGADAPGPPPWRRYLPWAVAAVAVVVAAVVVTVVVTGDGEDVTTTGSGSSSTSTSAGTASSSTASTATTSTSSSPSSTAPGPGAGGIDPMEGAGTSPVATPRPDIPTTHLTEVRVARQEGYDRVVFQFDGAVPGYDVRYVDPPITEDPSDQPVAVAGDAVLAVRMEPASGADLDGAEYRQIYTGPSRIPGTGGEVTEVVGTGDFESVLKWAIGLREKVDFRVSTLTAPSRVVIDVRNH